MPAVAYGLQDSHEYIVHNEGKGTHEVNTKINGGFGQYIRRRPHPSENMGGKENARYRQEDPGGQAEGNGGMY